MARSRSAIAWVVCMAVLCSGTPLRAVFCGEADAELAKEAEAIKKEIDELQKELDKSKSARGTVSKVDKALDKKKDDLKVKTGDGKLQIGGLMQTWYTWYQRDSRGLFDDPKNGVLDSNDANDNSSFRVRRAELNFKIKANAYVSAFVMIDPAAETNTFPTVTDNQAVGGSIFKSSNNISAEYENNQQNSSALGNYQTIRTLQFGLGVPNRILQDAYINFHNSTQCPGDFDWHHDFQVGQFIPAFGEEGLRSNAELDFAERSFVGMLGNERDLGAQLHGTWINDRFQYWVGLSDGADDYHQSNGLTAPAISYDPSTQTYSATAGRSKIAGANRSDTNNQKDTNLRMAVRPISNECWGDLELGYSTGFGYHGQGRIGDPIATAGGVNGLERGRTWAMRQDAWAYYAPHGCLNGFWARGEWGWFKDRNAPSEIVSFNQIGGTSYLNLGDNTGYAQSNGRAFAVQGWYAAGGYRFSRGGLLQKGSCLAENKFLLKLLKPMELAFRYQTFQNVLTADLIDPTKTDVFSTQVYTGGINYYIAEHNAKIQMNYNQVINPESHAGGGQRDFHNVRNNSFVISFQVGF